MSTLDIHAVSKAKLHLLNVILSIYEGAEKVLIFIYCIWSQNLSKTH